MEFQDASLDPKFSFWSSWHPFFMSAMLQWMHQVTPYILEIHFSIQALPHNPNLQGWWQYGHVELQPMVQWNHGTSIRLLPRGRASFHNAHTKNNMYIYISIFVYLCIYLFLLILHSFVYLLKKKRFPPVFFFSVLFCLVFWSKKGQGTLCQMLGLSLFLLLRGLQHGISNLGGRIVGEFHGAHTTRP